MTDLPPVSGSDDFVAASVYHSWRARLVRIRVYMAKRDPYPEEEWAWEK